MFTSAVPFTLLSPFLTSRNLGPTPPSNSEVSVRFTDPSLLTSSRSCQPPPSSTIPPDPLPLPSSCSRETMHRGTSSFGSVCSGVVSWGACSPPSASAQPPPSKTLQTAASKFAATVGLDASGTAASTAMSAPATSAVTRYSTETSPRSKRWELGGTGGGQLCD